MGSMTNEAAFIELLHTLMHQQAEVQKSRPTLHSASAQGEISNTFIYTYAKPARMYVWMYVYNSFLQFVFFGNCHNAPLVKAVRK